MHHMFKTCFIFFSLTCIPLLHCMEANTAPTYIINCNPNVTPHIDLHPHITIANSSAFSIKIGDITLQCIQKIQNTVTPKNYHRLKDFIAQALWEYRYHIAAWTVVGSYSATSLLLVANYYQTLQSNTLWARWKPESTFEDLCTLPQKDLTHELLCAINKRYYNKNQPTNFAHPLTTFLTTIDAEIKTCKRYIKIAKTIKRLRMMAIFPTNDNKIGEVNKLLERTLFIKHLFLSWLAEYNIASNPKN